MVEKYIGGRGLGARLLFDILPAKTESTLSGKRAYLPDRTFDGNPGSWLVQICCDHQIASHSWVVRQLFQRKNIGGAEKGRLRRHGDPGKIELSLLSENR